MANLPLSSQADSLDSLTVTREQFRLQQSDLLEFLAQALGNVSGDYTTQAVSPTGVVLQGTPTLAAGAEPTAVDNSLRLACTRWVRRNAASAGTVAPLNPVRGQVWVDTGSDPPAIKAWDDTPAPGSWVTLGLVPDATTTSKGIVQLADAAAISAGTAGRVVDAAQLQAAANKSGMATAIVASGSNSVFDFTSIPSWVKRITLMCYQVSTTAAASLYVRIGSGSFQATGYSSTYWYASTGAAVSSDAFVLSATASAYLHDLTCTLTLVGSNKWMLSGMSNIILATNVGVQTIGSVDLSGTLDRLRFATNAGAFDAGTVNILYEG